MYRQYLASCSGRFTSEERTPVTHSEQIKDYDLGGTSSADRDKKCIQGFGRKTYRKETTLEIYK
jgi:hypothetical protein